MSLRIAFDLDGVLADMDGELTRHAERLFGAAAIARPSSPRGPQEAVSPANAPGGPSTFAADEDPAGAAPPLPIDLSPRDVRRLWREALAIENFWTTLPEIEPGTVARLGELAVERRWEVIFLTRRPPSAGLTAQLQTQRWLERHGFALPSVFVVTGSRGRIAEALHLDLVIDDRPENCLDVVTDSRARAILVCRGDEHARVASARRLGVGVVKSMAECLSILVELDAPTSDRPGVVARVMRALGMGKR